MLLLTFMIAAGALTGEAFYGVESAVLAVLDESFKQESWWPYARISSLFIINLIVGSLIYVLFRRAGIIGKGGGGSGEQKDVIPLIKTRALDAELAE